MKAGSYWGKDEGIVLTSSAAKVYLNTVDVRILIQELSLSLDNALQHEWWTNNPEERAKNEESIASYHASLEGSQ